MKTSIWQFRGTNPNKISLPGEIEKVEWDNIRRTGRSMVFLAFRDFAGATQWIKEERE
jgi:hypothetical protein